MKKLLPSEFVSAQSIPQIERFVLSDGILVIEKESDYQLKSLPQEVRDMIDARNAPPVPYVPESITRTAGLQTLDDFGLAPAYTAWANSMTRTFREKALLDAVTWRRDDPVLIAAAAALNVSDKLDALFLHAKATYDKGD